MTDSVIKYMYITLYTTFTCTCLYTYQQVFALDWEWTRHINRRKPTGEKGGKDRKKDRQRERKKTERKKERKKEWKTRALWQESEKAGN